MTGGGGAGIGATTGAATGAAIGAATLINPIAGAAALVASTVLQNPLGRLLSYRYRISGSWVDPQVEKIGQSLEEPAPRPSEGLRP